MKRNKNMLYCSGVCRYMIVLLRKIRLLVFCIGLISICFIINMENQVIVPEGVGTEYYMPYEPELHEDFPSGSKSETRIPHILHQAYIDNYIPATYASNINSFHEFNKDWEYFLWTEQSAEKLIVEKYSSLFGTWDLYKDFKERSKIIPYIALYEFGGVYAHMRTEWLRPLLKMTFKYACIFTVLPFEKAMVGFNKPYLLNNDLIFCRPKHPFIKQIIDNLPLYQPMVENLDSTGPHFVTSQFILYNKQRYYWQISEKNISTNNSPFFYTSYLPEIHEDAVFVPNTKYFPVNLNRLYELCNDFVSLSFIEKKGCAHLGKTRDINVFAFTFNNGKRTFYESVLDSLFQVEILHLVGKRLHIY